MNEIGRLLADAVPPLPEPVDRIGEVRARVRRARISATAGTCAAVAVLAGLAAFFLPRPTDEPAPVATGLDAASCPDYVVLPGTAGEGDRTGPLVPDGATEVMLCEVNRADQLVGHQVLRAEADQVTDVLNALPTGVSAYEEFVGGFPGCDTADYDEQYSLVLRYPDGTIVTVFYDRDCDRSVVPGEGVRFGNALCEFGQLYREQAIEPVPVPEPGRPCD